MKNSIDDDTLIDRHLAGILTDEEEARLETLIRASPEWAQRYAEAENLARLLREGLQTGPAPADVKDRIRHRVADSVPERTHRLRLVPAFRRALAVAAALLLVLGAAVFWPGDDGRMLGAAYANTVPPLKDLARASDVLLVGKTMETDGAVRLALERTLYGDATGCACELPDGTRPGQRVALFGRHEGNDVIRVVGGADGIVHLDGVQRWEGKDLPASETTRRLEQATTERTLVRALADLRAFLASDATYASRSEDGLEFSAEITARFLGRFEADATREDLMTLIAAAAKRPEVRNAAAQALVKADPLGTCRELLTRILAGPVEQMHAETEDGLVVLGCLHLIQETGRADLADDLARFVERVTCPGLARAAAAALAAAKDEGPRTPPPSQEIGPARVTLDGREAVVLPACEGDARNGLLVVVRDARPIQEFRALSTLAVGRGYGVLLLPKDAGDVRPWVRQAASTGRVPSAPLKVLDAPGDWLHDLQKIRTVLEDE